MRFLFLFLFLTVIAGMNILASRKYFLDAVRLDRSGNKGINSATVNLDTMFDIEKHEDEDDIEDGTNNPVSMNKDDKKQKQYGSELCQASGYPLLACS